MKGSHFVAFIFGAAAGSAVTWYYLKDRYEKRAQEDAESVKEALSKMPKYSGPQDSDEEKTLEVEKHIARVNEKPDISEYAKRLRDEGYTHYSGKFNSDEGDEEEEEEPPVPNRITSDSTEKPYVIPPDQFDEFDDYTVISLMYYADGQLADDDDELVEDVDDVVGVESLGHFGEYDDDVVYVRNDRLKVDYEILRSERTYSEIIESKPYLREDR